MSDVFISSFCWIIDGCIFIDLIYIWQVVYSGLHPLLIAIENYLNIPERCDNQIKL